MTHEEQLCLYVQHENCVFARRQEYCKKLHGLIDKIDEDRYDVEAKVQKADKEVNSSRQNHADRLTDRKLKQKAFSLLVD